jgi:hypothetical protein
VWAMEGLNLISAYSENPSELVYSAALENVVDCFGGQDLHLAAVDSDPVLAQSHRRHRV